MRDKSAEKDAQDLYDSRLYKGVFKDMAKAQQLRPNVLRKALDALSKPVRSVENRKIRKRKYQQALKSLMRKGKGVITEKDFKRIREQARSFSRGQYSGVK